MPVISSECSRWERAHLGQVPWSSSVLERSKGKPVQKSGPGGGHRSQHPEDACFSEDGSPAGSEVLSRNEDTVEATFGCRVTSGVL